MSGKTLNPFQHALIRPDKYIGSIKTVQKETHFWNYDDSISFQNIIYNRGLYNIIKEIGSNCIDNKWRSQEEGIVMKSIKITWNSETKTLSFWNDGRFIPVEKREYKYDNYRKGTTTLDEMYPAEAFFGEMLAGTNFDDEENRKTSGRNGVGGKVANVYSTEFTVRHSDTINSKQFLQVYTNNAKERTRPEITAYKAKTAFTEISFIPDFKRFEYDIFNEDIEATFIGVLGMYILEIAAVTALPVTFEIIPNPLDETSSAIQAFKKVYHYKTFDKYVRMFYPDASLNKLSSMTIENGDECVIIDSHVLDDEEIPDTLDNLKHISFVNGVRTQNGGVHVDAWKDAIIPAFVRAFNARKVKKGETALKTTAKEVYPYITIFLRTEMYNPSFDEQTKDLLNGPEYLLYPKGKSKADKEKQTLFKEEIDKLIIKMLKWNFVQSLEEKLRSKNGVTVKTQKGEKILNFGKKLQDANRRKSEPEKCILYITEGLSAKAFVLRGISKLERGQDYNGAFAIQGKFINVVKSTDKQIAKNPEVEALLRIVNLKMGVDYRVPENFATLRYQKGIRFATDMDDDGIHIRGLLLLFFYKYWPELYDMGYISSLSTGVSKVWFTGKKEKEALLFFSNPEYKEWYDDFINSIKDGKPQKKIQEVKYLKGLAAINPTDAPKYFLDPKIVNYFSEGDEQPYMELGFGDTKIDRDNRKDWIVRDMDCDEFTKYYTKFCKDRDTTILKDDTTTLGDEETLEDDTTTLGDEATLEDDTTTLGDEATLEDDTTQSDDVETTLGDDNFVYDGDLSLSTFVDRQLIIYHKMVLCRAIPNIMDGLKNGQRKVLYAIRFRNYKKTADLEKVAGAIKEITGYHHGAASLLGTIKGMASRFPGSNNIALLEADGEFGTRMTGNGEDAGQARYISTGLEELTKSIFLPIDDALLTKVIEDDEPAEYEFFIPVVCMLLINGAEGIACGVATKIANYNPDDIVRYQRAWLNGTENELPDLVPWYRGINGPIELVYPKDGSVPIRWKTQGILTECGKGCKIIVGNKKCGGKLGWWHITDAPVGLWTSTLKEYLEYLCTCAPPKEKKSWKKLEKACITDMDDYNDSDNVHFLIKPAKHWDPCMDTTLKILTTHKSLANMWTIDSNYYPNKFASAEDILSYWCPARLTFYDKRYSYLLDIYKKELQRASNKYIFVKAVVDKKLNMYQTEENLERDMIKLGLQKLEPDAPKNKKNKPLAMDVDESQSVDDDINTKDSSKASFKYLKSMKIWSMTVKKLEALKNEADKIKNKIEMLESKTSKDLWREDLDNFEVAYKKYAKQNFV